MRSFRTRLTPALVPLIGVAVSLTTGCADGSDPGAAEVIVTDSMGISVFTHQGGDGDLESWGLDPEPVLQLGRLEGDGPDVFGRITSLMITDDGGVVVSDALAGEVRSFSPGGDPLGSFGRLGEGPGEFSNGVSVLHVSDDSLWGWDPRQQRVSVFVDGEFATSWSMPSEVVLSRAMWVDGRVLGEANARLSGIPETGMNRPGARVLSVGANGTATALFDVAGHERFLDIRLTDGEISGVNVFQPPFARGPFMGLASSGADTRIIGGPNDRFVLREWALDGTLRAIHRYPRLDRPVTEARLDQARSRIRDRYEEPTTQMQQELAALDENVPAWVPAFDRVWTDDEDRLWVRRSVEDGVEEWLIFETAELTPVARLVLPEGFSLFDVRDEALGGRWVDDLDVPHVRLYRLRTGG